MKLEKNMYVRTKDSIVKIEKILDGVMWDTQGHLHFGDFVKASHNIIDLIEVGDYVNGREIINIDCYECEDELFFDTAETINSFVNEDIKSIVTKEQFESMSYKVEG